MQSFLKACVDSFHYSESHMHGLIPLRVFSLKRFTMGASEMSI